MNYQEVHRDLFSVDFNKYTPVHCISLDCKMGAGIAVPMKKKFKLSGLYKVIEEQGTVVIGDCVYYNGVFNLMTKENYWHKPTMLSLENSLTGMLYLMDIHNINKIVMPRIGSGLDKLNWGEVKNMIFRLFSKREDIEIMVCYI